MNTEHQYIIYEIENQINGKKYVGQTIRGFNKRKNEHISQLTTNHHHNQHLQNAWNKYGEQNFTFNILEECDYEDLNYLETNYIFMWDLTNNTFGYNQTEGGEGTTGYTPSLETRKRIGDASKKMWKNPNSKVNSKDFRKYLSDSRKGQNNSMFKKNHLSKTTRKMSKNKTSTGFFRVYKSKKSSCKQGFIWKYQYYDNINKRKTIRSVDLDKLEQKVKNKGLDWIIVDDEKAKKTIEENNRLHHKGD